MFVSTINAISQSGQAYSHKNLGPARRENSPAAPLQKARKIPGHGGKSYLPLPKKELNPSKDPADGLSSSAITCRWSSAISSRPLRPNSSIRFI